MKRNDQEDISKIYVPQNRFQNVGFCDNTTISNQFEGTCYAHAAADIIRMTCSRIVGMEVPIHDKLVKGFISHHGIDGGPTADCIGKKNFPFIRCDEINFEQCQQVIRNRPFIFTWVFDANEWELFELLTHSSKKDDSIITKKKWDRMLKEHKFQYKTVQQKKQGKDSHAVVVVDMYYERDSNEWILQFKNSWGTEKCNEGVYYVSVHIFKSKKIYDVYFLESDLSDELKAEYNNYRSKNNFNMEAYMRNAYMGNSITSFCNEVHNISSHGEVIIRNSTTKTIKYHYEYVGVLEKDGSIEPGEEKFHGWGYGHKCKVSPKFIISFQSASLNKRYELVRYQVLLSGTGEGKVYQFKELNNNVIELYSVN